MGYLSCRADSSVATCRSITAISPLPLSRRSGVGGRRHALPTAAAKEGDEEAAAASIERFAYDELEAATSHFADAALLGRGSHGAVYKAVLASGRAVAVKRPSPRRPEVDNEIHILSSVRGPRLVNLLGFSDSGTGADHHQQHLPRLLVVEYMPNGTLYELLHSNPRPPGWPRRIRLALQTARALRALHDADPPVIHRDVKSANVLLDANLDARLGDFGLALRVPKRLPGEANATTTPAPAGTLGYLDPAYVTPESLSTKTDVFSFGILLLEIMSGRKAIDVQHSPPSVVEWAVPLLRKGNVASLLDPRVAPPRDPVIRRDLAALAASCVRSCRERRPSMADIVERLVVLSKAVSVKVWNGLAVVGNPCAVVDVQKTIAKRAAAAAAADAADDSAASRQELTSALAFDDDEKKEGANAGALDEEQLPLVGAKKAPRPLKNGKVFSESGARERRNLVELMARIDGVADQRFGITRARTVRAASEPIEKDAAVSLLRRNQTVKLVGSEVLSKADIFSSLDTKINLELGKEQHEKAGKIKQELEHEQEKEEKIKHNTGTGKEHGEKAKIINREAGKDQEKVEKNQEKEMKIQEKLGDIFDKAKKSEEKTWQILVKEEKKQDTAEKKHEHDARGVPRQSGEDPRQSQENPMSVEI